MLSTLKTQKEIATARNLTLKLTGRTFISAFSVDYDTNTTTIEGITYNVAKFQPKNKRQSRVVIISAV